jgi:hypothetical protein
MKLLTKEIKEKLPTIKSTEEKAPADIPIIVKFFTPWSNFTWWVTEGEAELDESGQETGDYLFFGFVSGFERELGYFVLSELLEVKEHYF